MNKVLQATSRGQITLPKKWRDKFATSFYTAEVKDNEVVITPILKKTSLDEELASAWKEYKEGNYISHEEIMKQYGL